jgi:RNA polymerase sigma-70 factor (ECF subfamily)
VAERWSDEQLVRTTLAGDREAFGELVARHRESAFALALRRLGDFEAASDATQEAFVKAYVNLSTLREPARFGAWLSRIVERTAISLARSPRREIPLGALPQEEQPAAQRTPQEWVEQTDLARHVREHLAALSEPTRRAVILHHIDGYSHAEVAARLGLTSSAVKTRLSRARSRLRRSGARWRRRKS